MAFFTGYFQKRALRFALSQLGLFDQDAFDIDSQGISWGSTTTIELRDLPLSIPRLTELLQLPPFVTITTSHLQYLRLTLPLNLLSNNIAIEVEGVRLKLLVSHDESGDTGEHLQNEKQYTADTRLDDHTGGLDLRQRDDKLHSGNRPNSPPLTDSKAQRGFGVDPSSPRKPRVSFSKAKASDRNEHGLPTTDDLAESFLAYESSYDRAETRAAIARERQRQVEPDEPDDIGLGPEISLKAFFSNLAKGVLDRFKASIKDVQIEAVFKVPGMPEGDNNYANSSDEVTFCLDVESIIVPPVDSDANNKEADSVPEQGELGRARNISIQGMHASLLVTSALSSFMTQLSQPASPTLSRATSKLSETMSSQKSSSQGSRLQSAFSHRRDFFTPTSQPIRTSTDPGRVETAIQNQPHSSSRVNPPASVDTSFHSRMDDEPAFSFGQDSQQQHIADPADARYELDNSQLFASEMTGSALSASSESFLSKPPTNSPPLFRRGLAFSRDPSDLQQSATRIPEIQSMRSTQAPSVREDLTESKIFSPSQARSMYISAMSSDRPDPLVPGAWGSSDSDPNSPDSDQNSPDSTTDVFHDAVAPFAIQSTSLAPPPAVNEVAEVTQRSFLNTNLEFAESGLPEDDDSPPSSLLVSKRSNEFLNPPLVDDTPAIDILQQTKISQQISLPESINIPSKIESFPAVKTLLVVNSIKIRLPPAAPAPIIIEPRQQETGGSSDLPGAFSIYRSLEDSVFSEPQASIRQTDTRPEISIAKRMPSIDVQFDTIVCCFDMAFIRLLSVVLRNLPSRSQQPSQESTKAGREMTELNLNVQLKQFTLRFQEDLKNQTRNSPEALANLITEVSSATSRDLFRVAIANVRASLDRSPTHSSTEILIAKFQLGFPDEHVISFDQDSRLRESTRDTMMPTGQDISIKRLQSLSSPDHFEINTASIHINANINRLAEMINWLGGLSTVLDLKNSMRSTITVTEAKTSPAQSRPRGVHFDLASTSTEPSMQPKAGPKINVRIGGTVIDVEGVAASVRVESSALKIVVRDGAIRTQIDRINFHGPLTDIQTGDTPLTIAIDTLQVAYFNLPKEADLTKLLTLLSPSQDRDDQDDDILLDTLLRQRRKGSLLRISVAKAKLRVSQLKQFQHFSSLVEEASQLSSVTKYLPEDDRPGLLIMTRVDETNIELDVDRNINSLSLCIRNIDLALVTFPSLFLVSVGQIDASHNGLDLIGTATPEVRRSTTKQPSFQDILPKLSVRFIAGEMEPTLRIKLYNIRFEYHVSTIMSFLGISEATSGEIIVAEMVNSVANLAVPSSRLAQSSIFQQSSVTKDQKPLKIDLSIRDIVLGLNPKDKPAKGLLVLTNSRISGVFPDGQASESCVLLEINKAHFMVIDDKRNIRAEEDITDPNVMSSLGTKPTQLQSLEAVGYVSVGQTSAASITITLTNSTQGSLLNVEVQNHLFVLETCADSTQTLLLVLGNLAPPRPPRLGNKYRTEVVPITDMLASFSGQAFATTSSVEDNSDEEVGSEDETGTIALDDEDDLSVDLDLDDDFFTGSAENDSVASFGIGSILFKQTPKPAQSTHVDFTSTQEQVNMASSVLLGADHFGARGKRSAREWDSYQNRYHDADPGVVRASPLQISLKDIHFIWHLYDGYDWQKTRDTIAQTVDEIEAKAEERRAARRDKLRTIDDDENETVIGDMLFNSIYIGISAKDDPRNLSHRINGLLNDNSSDTGSYATTTTTSATSTRPSSPRHKKKRLRLGRSQHHKMTFELKGVSGNIVSFPPESGETQSSVRIRVRDLEVFDNIPSSTWRKFATYMRDAGRREKDASMVEAEILVVKPDPDLLASEFVVKIDVLPLRLHVDQDALDFMTRFFEFRDDTTTTKTSTSDVPFIQRAEVGPIQIKLDFKPKRIDWRALRSGKTSEFMNFIILDEADMILRKIILYGVPGFDRLGHTLNDLWTPDVKANQLPGVLAGLAPVRPLVNLGSGVRDLVVIPMREYKKDGRLVRAVRKGVMSFGKTTTTELAKLGAKLAIGTHTMLSNAEGLLSPETRRPSSRGGDEFGTSALEEQATLSPYANPPVGVVQGLRGAYRGLERDLLLAKDAIIAMPGEVVESESASGAAAAVLRNAPIVILRPAMGVTKAIGQTLMGATNALDRTERRRIEDKYKYR